MFIPSYILTHLLIGVILQPTEKWLAWIPLLNIILLIRNLGRRWPYAILLVIPYINIIYLLYLINYFTPHNKNAHNQKPSAQRNGNEYQEKHNNKVILDNVFLNEKEAQIITKKNENDINEIPEKIGPIGHNSNENSKGQINNNIHTKITEKLKNNQEETATNEYQGKFNDKAILDDMLPNEKDEAQITIKKKYTIRESINYNGFFDNIYIHDNLWEYIKTKEKLKKRLSYLINRIEFNYLNENHVQKKNAKRLKNSYKIYWNDKFRLLYDINNQDNIITVRLYEIVNHTHGEILHKHNYNKQLDDMLDISEFKDDSIYIEETIDDHEEKIYYPLFREWTPLDEEYLVDTRADLPWMLVPEQKNIVGIKGPVLLKGSAGSGKTTISIYRLLQYHQYNKMGRNIYLTYTPHLKKYAKEIYDSLLRNNHEEVSEFYTLEEKFRDILGENSKKFKEEDKLTFLYFREIPFLKAVSKKYNLEMLWEEFRGVIKGAFQQSELEKGALSFDEYLEIPSKQSLIKSDKEHIYELFTKYENHKINKGYWDDLDLVIEVNRKIKENNEQIQQYSQVIVDEVQDLTSLHLFIILQMASNPDGIFLCGDSQQIIHPNRFEWERTKQLIYKYLTKYKTNNTSYYNKIKVELQELKINYRSSKQIVDITNRLSEWRNKEFRESNNKLEAIFSEEDIVVINEEYFKNVYSDTNVLSHQIMILVMSETAKLQASTLFFNNKKNIFTIEEAKGLESKHAIVFKFFQDIDINFLEGINAKDEHRKKFIVSILNVAITRARKNLIFIEEKWPSWYEPLSNIDYIHNDNANDILLRIFGEKSSKEDFNKYAVELEKRELFTKAAEYYFASFDNTNGNRCMAVYCEKKYEYEKAGDFYEKAGLYIKSLNCYEKVKEYKKAFNVIINNDDNNKNNEIAKKVEMYLNDIKIISKLGGYGEIISQAILRNNNNIDIAHLFDYSLNRYRLYSDLLSQRIQYPKKSFEIILDRIISLEN